MSRVTLRKLFGSEMAQEDPNFLSYVMPRPDCLAPLSDTDFKTVIINAARGSGKSGLLISLSDQIESFKDTKIIKRDYRDMVFPRGELSVNESINYWKNTILGEVVSEIGSEKGWAFFDDDIAAVELSESLGIKKKNLVSSVLSRLKFNSLPLERCELDPNLNINQLSRIVSASSTKFWVLLDEMDDIYDNGDQINLLIGLLQSASYLGSKIDNLWIRVTIRPHILTELRITNGTIQKLNEKELKIAWKKEQLKEILARRLDFFQKENSNKKQIPLELSESQSVQDKSCETSRLISTYFEDFDMGFAEGSKSDYRAFATLCFYRPRWLIEYCKEVRSITAEDKRSNLYHYKRAFLPFGNRRIQFISGEFSNTIPYVLDAMNALIARGKAGFGKSKKLRSAIINQIIMTGIVKAEESEYHRVALDIAKKLYMTEFIRAKEKIHGGGGYHRFYYFVDRPDLLSTWQQRDTILWEIHPTFQRAFNLEDSQVYKVSEDVKVVGNKHQDKEGAT